MFCCVYQEQHSGNFITQNRFYFEYIVRIFAKDKISVSSFDEPDVTDLD